MTKHRSLVYGAALPQDFLDAIQELLGSYISPNMAVSVLNATTVQLAAGTDNAQISLAINGKWRYVTTAVNATHPGGAAGIYALWATASDNSFTVGPPEVDSTVYTFALLINSGATPGTALSRQIGYVEWNGSAITNARLLTDDSVLHGTLEPGDYIYSASPTRQGALLCDGASYLRATYPALFNALGGTSSPYGLPDGTHFNVPDHRGRALIGAGTGAGLTARTAAATGGAETVTLAAAESGLVGHSHAGGGAIVGSTVANQTASGFKTAVGVTGTGTTGAGSASGGNTDWQSGDHQHWIDVRMIPRFSTLVGSGGTPAFGDQYGSDPELTGGQTAGHYHLQNPMTVAGLSIPALSIPQLTIPQLTIPSLVVNATDPAPAAVASAAASSGHANMQPWLAGYVFVKI